MKKLLFSVLIVIVAVLGLSGCCSYEVAVPVSAYPYRTYYYSYYYSVYPPRPYYYSPYYGYYYRPVPPPPRRHRHHRH